jgi:hypothetical protein
LYPTEEKPLLVCALTAFQRSAPDLPSTDSQYAGISSAGVTEAAKASADKKQITDTVKENKKKCLFMVFNFIVKSKSRAKVLLFFHMCKQQNDFFA